MQRAIRGTLAGLVGWWAMDQALQGMYNAESRRTRRQEQAARRGIPALQVLLQRITDLAGIPLTAGQRERAGPMVQWVVGTATGAVYGVLRDRLPGTGLLRGALYGAAVSLIFDEGLIPLLKLSPGPTAFPWQTHARGVVGHLVFGVVAEAVLQGIDRNVDREWTSESIR